MWPAAVRGFVEGRFGRPLAVEGLGGGQSGASVQRVRFAAGSVVVVVKGSVEPREAHVYRVLRPTLEAAGVALPRLEWASDDGWLVLEYVPRRIPIAAALGHTGAHWACCGGCIATLTASNSRTPSSPVGLTS